MKFNKKYTDYWQKTVLNSIDGTKIPGPNEAEIYLKQMKIKVDDKILDLGCSYGRFLENLKQKTSQVYGVDPDPFAVSKAKKIITLK